MKPLTLPHCTIELHDGWVVTRFHDDASVTAVPQADQVETARQLGYGDDVAAMTMEHDPLHSILAQALYDAPSASLWAVAHGLPMGPVEWKEERQVMELQRLLRLLRIAQEKAP